MTEVTCIISSQLPGVITTVLNRGLLHLLKVGRRAGVSQLWQSADTLLSTGGEGVKQWAGQDKVSLPCCPLEKQWPWSPWLGFLSITCVLCRDLLYITKGLRDWFFHPVFWRTGSFVRLWWGVYCLKPHVCVILITCPERGCFLRKCLLNTLKSDDLSSVTLTVWFPEELWQC